MKTGRQEPQTRHDLEEKLAEQITLNRQKDEFIRTLSHELRTPLSTIVGWTHEIMSESLDETMMDIAIKCINRSAQSQLKIVNDLLDLSAVASGSLKFSFEPVDITSLLREAVDEFQTMFLEKNIIVTFDFDTCSINAKIEGDYLRLTQVFRNILSNSLKYSNQGGKISIQTRCKGRQIDIEFADDGIGIDPDFLPFIFNLSTRGHSNQDSTYEGLGLGLSLVKTFLNEHQGYINVESKGVNQGSKFTVTLPTKSTHRSSQNSQPSADLQ